MNLREQVKATPQVIEKFIMDNANILSKTMTHHDYPKKIANAIIDDDTGKELHYFQLCHHPKHQKIWKQSFDNKLGRLVQGAGGRVE